MNLSLNNVRSYNTTYKNYDKTSRQTNTINFKGKEPNDKSSNGKFDSSEAMKNLGKGIISPLTAMVKHPIMAIGMVAGTIALTTAIPVLGPIMAVGFGAYSVYQLGKGTTEAVKNYKNGKYDEAEKSFDKIGQGLIGTILSALGVKQGAKIAKEAKFMSENNLKSLTIAQRDAIATEVKAQSYFSALKENLSLVTTKTGIKSVVNQFKPSVIKTRVTEAFDFLKGNRRIEQEKEIFKKKKVKGEDFKTTPEGIRRANLTQEEIQQEVTALYDEAFEKLGIAKEQRPKLVIETGAEKHGGSYCNGSHELKFNPESYKAGNFEIEDVIMHEATHCQEALLRAGIPQDRVDMIVKEQLIKRIMTGESEEILVSGNLFGADMMTPPKMSPKMKQDFCKFAQTDLYQPNINRDLIGYIHTSDCSKSTASEIAKAQQKVQPILDKLKLMINNNPEFVNQYENEAEALKMLAKYSYSHNFRYNVFSDVKINTGSSFMPNYLKVEPVTAENLARAEQSLIDNIETIEGNCRNSGINGIFQTTKGFNQYQFSPEEVLAQKNGNSFVIEKYTNKLAEMRAKGTINPQEEARIIKVINKAQKIIEYKTKGLEYYKNYTQMINNPNNKELAKLVQQLEKELELLKKDINPKQFEEITEVIKIITYKPDLATTMFPASAIYNLLAKLESKKSA